jgi:hypothetical protein
MTWFEAEVFDGGGAGFADPQPVQTEQHRRRGMIAVVLLGGEQEHAELGSGRDRGRSTGAPAVGGRTAPGSKRCDPSMCAKRYKPHTAQPAAFGDKE